MAIPTDSTLHIHEHRWSARLWIIGGLFLFVAGFGYWNALDGAGVASPNVAPLRQAQTSSEYRMVWFGNLGAAKTIFVVFAPIGFGFVVVGAVVREFENKRIRALYADLSSKREETC